MTLCKMSPVLENKSYYSWAKISELHWTFFLHRRTSFWNILPLLVTTQCDFFDWAQNLCPNILLTSYSYNQNICSVSKLSLIKYGPIRTSFRLIFVLSSYQHQKQFQFQHFKSKKHTWCAWDINLGLQDGRRRWNHWAMAAAPKWVFLTA